MSRLSDEEQGVGAVFTNFVPDFVRDAYAGISNLIDNTAKGVVAVGSGIIADARRGATQFMNSNIVATTSIDVVPSGTYGDRVMQWLKEFWGYLAVPIALLAVFMVMRRGGWRGNRRSYR